LITPGRSAPAAFNAGTPKQSSAAQARVQPVFLLSLPLTSLSSILHVLGQRPDIYVLQPTHLFIADSLEEWRKACIGLSLDTREGLVRVVSDVFFPGGGEGQGRARMWIQRRAQFNTIRVFRLIARRARPRTVVERSPTLVHDIAFMQRARTAFAKARFIHIVQHPRQFCTQVCDAVERMAARRRIPSWLARLACPPCSTDENTQEKPEIDPQQAWHQLHTNVCDFLETVDKDQKCRFRIEDLEINADSILKAFPQQAGQQISPAEESLIQGNAAPSPLDRRKDDLEVPFRRGDLVRPFLPNVKALAKTFGYE
jgi:hypothetical protein